VSKKGSQTGVCIQSVDSEVYLSPDSG